MRGTLFTLIVLLLVPIGAMSQTPPVNAPDAQQVVGVPQGQPLTGVALEQRTKEVASLLRCPVCQGLSVYDSPASMAVNMKHQVRELLSRGFTQDQILKYFVNSYGEFVLLEPSFRGFNSLVWLAPVVLLIGGGVLVFFVLRKMRGSQRETPADAGERELPDPNRLPDDPALAMYVLRVRELAYGWRGGVAPDTNTEGTHA